MKASMSKNLVLCFDGTSDGVDANPSNVLRLFKALSHGPSQTVFYESGIGTLMDPEELSPWSKLARRGLDLACGFGLREKVISGCTFLAEKYEPGDKIFLFGFSRGAYTARCVAGMTRMFGLLRKEHVNLLPYVWQCYSDNSAPPNSAGEKALFLTAAQFTKYFSREAPRFHFVGCYDTVSSFGFLGMFRTLPYTRKNDLIDHFRHATSLDERRAGFPLNPAVAASPTQDYKAVWFAGVHDDIGGGQPDSGAALAKVALAWMMKQAGGLGLLIDSVRSSEVLTDPDPDPSYACATSLSWYWILIGLLPLRSWDAESRGFRWHWPNFRWIRPVADGDQIYASVFEKLASDKGYSPVNLPSKCVVVWPDGVSSELDTAEIIANWPNI